MGHRGISLFSGRRCIEGDTLSEAGQGLFDALQSDGLRRSLDNRSGCGGLHCNQEFGQKKKRSPVFSPPPLLIVMIHPYLSSKNIQKNLEMQFAF